MAPKRSVTCATQPSDTSESTAPQTSNSSSSDTSPTKIYNLRTRSSEASSVHGISQALKRVDTEEASHERKKTKNLKAKIDQSKRYDDYIKVEENEMSEIVQRTMGDVGDSF